MPYSATMDPRLGIGPDYYKDVKASNWPAFEDLVNLQWIDLNEDMQHRHWYEPSYHPSLYPVLRHVFPGMERIDRSYSQALQDIFILTFLDGKRNGTYLEIGSFHPTKINNTRLLIDFGWSGISIDKWQEMQMHWRKLRPHCTFVLADALQLDYKKLLDDHSMPERIDFLQTDIDSKSDDIVLLEKVLETGRKFSLVMFEHNLQENGPNEKIQSTQVLERYGYKKIVDNIACKDFHSDQFMPFEDWWVDPTAVDPAIYTKFLTESVDLTHPLTLLCLPGSIDHLMRPVWQQKDIWKSR